MNTGITSYYSGTSAAWCVFNEVTQNDSLHLAWLVQTYLESFKDLYGGSSITPKMHHLVHLPEQILLRVTYKLTGLSHKCCTFVSYKQELIMYR